MDIYEFKRILTEEKEKNSLTMSEWVVLLQSKGVGKSASYRTLSDTGYDFTLRTMNSMLNALNLKFEIEDEDIDWGMDMARLRRMPKRLYHGERIEAREHISEEGLYPRVDFFDSIEAVLKFIPTPCDVYEVFPHKLRRRYFDVVDHPFGTMYSYNEHVPKEFILSKTTYR